MKTKNATVSDALLNTRQMCESLSISRAAFQKWKVEPTERKGNQTFYSVRAVIDNRLAHEAEKNSGDGSPLSQEEIEKIKTDTMAENRRLKKEQADNLELKNELIRGHSIPAEMAGHVLGRISAQLVSVLEQIPAAIKRRLPEINSKDLDVVRKEVAACRNIASNCDQYVDEYIDEYLEDAKNSA